MNQNHRPIVVGIVCFTNPSRGISQNGNPLYHLEAYQEYLELWISAFPGAVIATPEFAEQLRFKCPTITVVTPGSDIPVPEGTIHVTQNPHEALSFAKKHYHTIWSIGGNPVHEKLFREYDFLLTMELYEGNIQKKASEVFPDFIELFSNVAKFGKGFIPLNNLQYKLKSYEKIA
jgi:hypothetical protein